MDIDADPANDEHPEANGEEVEAATSIQATEKYRALFRPVITESAAVLEAIKARPGNVEVCPCAERRPTLTASARAGVRNLRSGRKKACGAVEQKKAAKQGRKKSGKKTLAFVAAIRERRNGPEVEQRN